MDPQVQNPLPVQPQAPQSVQSPTSTQQPQAIYASFGRRLVASLTDGLLMVLSGFVLGFIPSFIYGFSGGAEPAAIKNLGSIASYIIGVAYYVYFISSRGQTLGKKWFGVKVAKVGTNEAPGYIKAFLREIVGKLISAAVLLLGFFWMLWDPQKQTWHDKIAGTVVIRV